MSNPVIDFADLNTTSANGVVDFSDLNQAQERSVVVDFTDLEDNGKGRIHSAGSTFARGVSEAIADAGKGLARLASNPNLGVSPGGLMSPVNQQALEIEGRQYASLTPEQRQSRLETDPMFVGAEQFAAAGRENYQPNPRFQGEWLAEKIPAAAASTMTPLAAGLVAGPGAAALTYGAQSGQQGAQEAIDAGHVDDADKTFMGYAVAGGVSELFLGLGGNIWRYVRAARKAGVSPNRFAEWTRQVGKAAGREALQEGGEQVLQNAVFDASTGEDRPLTQGVAESMALGAIVGGGLHAAVTGPVAATARRPKGPPPIAEHQDELPPGPEPIMTGREITADEVPGEIVDYSPMDVAGGDPNATGAEREDATIDQGSENQPVTSPAASWCRSARSVSSASVRVQTTAPPAKC